MALDAAAQYAVKVSAEAAAPKQRVRPSIPKAHRSTRLLPLQPQMWGRQVENWLRVFGLRRHGSGTSSAWYGTAAMQLC